MSSLLQNIVNLVHISNFICFSEVCASYFLQISMLLSVVGTLTQTQSSYIEVNSLLRGPGVVTVSS